MGFPIVNEVWPFFGGTLALFLALGIVLRLLKFKKTAAAAWGLGLVGAAFMLFFFRDPERTVTAGPDLVVAGADGRVMAVKEVVENECLNGDAIRISIFLSLLDVHVNRAPVAGRIAFLKYYPGKRHFTFQEKSSEYNQHSCILIDTGSTRCLVKQIVGPVARRVVYWLEPGQSVQKGDRIGMMKFGSRLDMLFPKGDVEVLVRPGDKVRAGVTAVARLNKKSDGGGNR